jgi:hypothetical protein
VPITNSDRVVELAKGVVILRLKVEILAVDFQLVLIVTKTPENHTRLLLIEAVSDVFDLGHFVPFL